MYSTRGFVKSRQHNIGTKAKNFYLLDTTLYL